MLYCFISHTHTEHADKMGMFGAVREQNVVRTVSEKVNDESVT